MQLSKLHAETGRHELQKTFKNCPFPVYLLEVGQDVIRKRIGTTSARDLTIDRKVSM